MASAQVTSIHVFPVKGEPGQDLATAQVDSAGLTGDRPKKAPVHLVSAEEAEDVRANVVLTLSPADLLATVGTSLSVGEVVLDVARPAGNCPGVYAEVTTAGTVHIGDNVVTSVGGPP